MTTSPPASRSSSTSEAPPRLASPVGPSRSARLLGLLLLVHPYPSLLNAALTGVLASVAGAPPARAALLALAMALLQFSIGSLNDVLDAAGDAGHKPRKPIPRGLVGERAARVVAGTTLGLGLALAAAAGPATLLVAVVGVATGWAYDLRLKGGPVSWLPFAIGIPLVPTFAWVGATGSLPAPFLILLPLGAAAGAAIALANALADVERDEAAGRRSAATRLGPRRAWTATAALEAVVVLGAAGSLAWLGSPEGMVLAAVRVGGLVAGTALMVAGLVCGRPAARASAREVGWEFQAAGVGLVGVAWLTGVAGLLDPAGGAGQ